MLTATQMVAVATQSSAPPWRLSDLAKMYAISPLSLRSVANLMQQQKTYLLCEVRDLSLLQSSADYASLQAAWALAQPSQATLFQLFASLSAVGASIVYISKDWRRVGIATTLGAIENLHLYQIDLLYGSSVTPEPPVAQPRAEPPASPRVLPDWLTQLETAAGSIGGILIAYAGKSGLVEAGEWVSMLYTDAELELTSETVGLLTAEGIAAASGVGVILGALGLTSLYMLFSSDGSQAPPLSVSDAPSTLVFPWPWPDDDLTDEVAATIYSNYLDTPQLNLGILTSMLSAPPAATDPGNVNAGDFVTPPGADGGADTGGAAPVCVCPPNACPGPSCP